jgi:hypothetical protein
MCLIVKLTELKKNNKLLKEKGKTITCYKIVHTHFNSNDELEIIQSPIRGTEIPFNGILKSNRKTKIHTLLTKYNKLKKLYEQTKTTKTTKEKNKFFLKIIKLIDEHVDDFVHLSDNIEINRGIHVYTTFKQALNSEFYKPTFHEGRSLVKENRFITKVLCNTNDLVAYNKYNNEAVFTQVTIPKNTKQILTKNNKRRIK